MVAPQCDASQQPLELGLSVSRVCHQLHEKLQQCSMRDTKTHLGPGIHNTPSAFWLRDSLPDIPTQRHPVNQLNQSPAFGTFQPSRTDPSPRPAGSSFGACLHQRRALPPRSGTPDCRSAFAPTHPRTAGRDPALHPAQPEVRTVGSTCAVTRDWNRAIRSGGKQQTGYYLSTLYVCVCDHAMFGRYHAGTFLMPVSQRLSRTLDCRFTHLAWMHPEGIGGNLPFVCDSSPSSAL